MRETPTLPSDLEALHHKIATATLLRESILSRYAHGRITSQRPCAVISLSYLPISANICTSMRRRPPRLTQQSDPGKRPEFVPSNTVAAICYVLRQHDPCNLNIRVDHLAMWYAAISLNLEKAVQNHTKLPHILLLACQCKPYHC